MLFLQLNSNKDQKLLHQLDFEDTQMLQVRISSSSGVPNNQVKEVSLLTFDSYPVLTKKKRSAKKK